MHTAGGRVSIVIGGVVYSARGEVTINKSGITTTVGTNQDGSLYKTVAPKPKTAKFTFDRFTSGSGQVLRFDDRVMLMNNLAATFIEQDTGVTHLLTNGTFVGDPEENLGSGEVSGVEFAAEKYETI